MMRHKPDTCNKAGYRGVLRGTGEETVETCKTAYLRLVKFVPGKTKGAVPIICSPRKPFGMEK